MRPGSKLTEEQREQAVQLFEQGMGSYITARSLGVSQSAIQSLYNRFLLRGRLCLVEKRNYPKYTYELRKEVVDRFNAGASRMELAREYGLASDEVVKVWVRKWRKGGDEALHSHRRGRPKTSSKKTQVSADEQLIRENERLRAENAYLKKLRDLRNQGHA
ncbi:transposase [Corynebacterium sp. NML140438]|nr:transposase [Corynebacterium sp. NML140438]